MKILQINTLYGRGSTGKIVCGIEDTCHRAGIETLAACRYLEKDDKKDEKKVNCVIPVSSWLDCHFHNRIARYTMLGGCFSYITTLKFINKIRKYKPDIIHLHNIHGNFINLRLLFNYIKETNTPVVWTLHDCWAFTGQCPYFTMVKCDKWKTGCSGCSQYNNYLARHFDLTGIMWNFKNKWFAGVQNMTIVTPSQWLADLVKDSFLGKYPTKVINNGIDLSIFHPIDSGFREAYGLQFKKIVLSVAFDWDERKGFKDCLKLAEMLDNNYCVVLVGVSKEQYISLPKNMLGIERTNSQEELAAIYSAADVFINTTYEDNYPTVNLEARACGLPIISYKTGGSPESAGMDAVIIEPGDVKSLKGAVETIVQRRKQPKECKEISSEVKFTEYVNLYKSMLDRDDLQPKKQKMCDKTQ